MKKILSCILAAAMLVGMLTFGASSEAPDLMLKFNDILGKGEGGDMGMASYLGEGLSKKGYTMVMDFIYGRDGICYHPVDPTLKHTSKFAIMISESKGTFKYMGYSATEDAFYFARCANSPMYGEGSDGLEYLAKSETGLIIPGQKYTLAFEFYLDTGITIYVDGKEVLTFDLYEDLKYEDYFNHSGFMMFPTHMTCFIDNFAIYAKGTYDAATGEASAEPVSLSTFDNATIVAEDVVDANGNVTGTQNIVKDDKWQIVKPSYTLTTAEHDVYAQPQYIPAEDEVNVIFQGGLDKKANGADETFATGKDFNIDLTIKNNKGLDSLVLDLVQDELITVKSVAAADGVTATLGETDANGVTKLTITGDKYTGEALATITYTLSDKAVQDLSYGYGAKAIAEISGAEGMDDCIVTNGESKVYNYTIGDVNDDGNFDIGDVTVILQLSAKWDLPGVFKEAGDVNLDGRTNTMDVSYYLRWLAKWKRDYTINGITYY